MRVFSSGIEEIVDVVLRIPGHFIIKALGTQGLHQGGDTGEQVGAQAQAVAFDGAAQSSQGSGENKEYGNYI